MKPSLSLRHLALALLVVAIWGTNFVVIRVGLRELPPLTMAALRFAIAFVPAAFFVARPKVRLDALAAYGVLIGVGQFGVLYYAMRHDISPGLASLVIQSQAFFTIAIAMRLDGLRLRPYQGLAAAIALGGIGVILARTDGTTTPLGLGLVTFAAVSWAFANVVAARAKSPDTFAFVIWSSAFAVPPLVALAIAVDGWSVVASSAAAASPRAWLAVLWQAWGNTLIGYGIWAWLFTRYEASTVAPTALLVPVFGMAASSIVLGEPMPLWKIGAAALVVLGLTVNLVGARRLR